MRVAIAQMTSGSNPSENLRQVDDLAHRAAQAKADLIVFPEATMCAFGNDLSAVVEPLDGPWASRVRGLATDLNIVIVVGMFTPGSEGRVRNTLLAVGPGANTSYDKIHLFDAFGYRESDSVEPGTCPVTFSVKGVTVGLATCYDIRFPALFTANANHGARINVLCASWGAGEGKIDQWSLLARARALDSTTFVIACGQADPIASGINVIGTAPTGIGYSTVISPLGKVIEALGSGPALVFTDINTAETDDARSKLPVLANAHAF